MAYISRNVDLGNIFDQIWNFSDWSDLERSTNNKNEVNSVLVVIDKTLAKLVGQSFSKECDIGLDY